MSWQEESRPGIGQGSGAEQIARAAFVQIVENLESACVVQEEQWAPRDQEWAQLVGVPFVPTRIARVPKSSIYTGAQPSLVVGEASRFDKWPAITVRIGPREPSSTSEQADQYDSLDVTLMIEVLTLAGPFNQDPLDDRASSDAVDRQYQRLSDAVIACINYDRTLGGNILPLKLPPRMTPSLPWIRRTEQGAGGFLAFQGAELVWTATALMY